MTSEHNTQSPLQRSLNLMDKLCFDESFEFNHTTLSNLVGSVEAEYLLSQKQDRHLIYRDLVFDSITSTLLKTFSESLRHFPSESLNVLFRWFLSTQPVKSRHYKDIAIEFCDFIQLLKQNNCQSDHHQTVIRIFENNPFLFDLFLYEKSWHQLTFMHDTTVKAPTDPHQELDKSKVILNQAMIPLQLEFDVRKSNESLLDTSLIHIVLARDITTSTKMEFELNAFAFNLLQHLKDNPQNTIGDVLDFFTKSIPDTEIDAIQSDVLGLIKTFISNGIILGFE